MKKLFTILATAALAVSTLGAQELTNFAFGNRGPRIVYPELKDGKVTFRLAANYATVVKLSGNWMENPWPGTEILDKALTRNGMGHTLYASDGGHVWANWRLYLNTFARLLFK